LNNHHTMANLVIKTSSLKVGWSVAWAAFWTGFPLKMIAAVLLLAMHVTPWESTGLTTLLVVSIPIDMWALGLTARTYFLEQHGLELDGPVGLSLWWQGALIGGLFAAAGYYVLPWTITATKQLAAGIIGALKRVFPQLPIAEQITLELVLWSVPTTIVMVLLAFVALQIYGWRIKAVAEASGRVSGAPLGERVRRWDYSRIPHDPGVVLASLAGVVIVLTIAFWAFLSVTTPHPADEFKAPVAKPRKVLKPEELLKQTETSLAKAEAVLQALERDKGKEKKDKKQTKDIKTPEQKGK
jgi:hypothetical protein